MSDRKQTKNLRILFPVNEIYKKLMYKGYGKMKKVITMSRIYHLDI